MPKRLVLSPELLLIAPLPSQRQAIGAALRRLVMIHGEMPMVVSCETMPGEIRVDTPLGSGPRPFVHERIQFQIEDWHIPEPIVGRRVALG